MAKNTFIDQIRRTIEASELSFHAIGERISVDPSTMPRFLIGKRELLMVTLDRGFT